jgi:hypothetical protein
MVHPRTISAVLLELTTPLTLSAVSWPALVMMGTTAAGSNTQNQKASTISQVADGIGPE